MIKLITTCCICFIAINCSAQIQRTAVSTYSKISPKDPSDTTFKSGSVNAKNQKQIFREIGLRKEQKDKLKTIRQNAKSQKEAIINNDSITNKEKGNKLKLIRQETDAAIKNILTAEQWEKFEAERAAKKSD